MSLPVASAILAALAVLVPIVIFLAGRPVKELSFAVVAQSTLVDVTESKLSDFELRFRGEKIRRLDSVTVRLRNSGNLPIEARDFERPIAINLANNALVLSASVSDSTPANVSPALSTADHKVSIAPLLLNPGDDFSVSLFVEGDPSPVQLNARVSGIRSVVQMSPPSRELMPGLVLIAVSTLAFFVYFYLGGVFVVNFRRDLAGPATVPALDVLVVGLVSGVVAAALLVAARHALELSASRFYAAALALPLVCAPVFIAGVRRSRRFASRHQD
jgi:hypothetical protein